MTRLSHWIDQLSIAGGHIARWLVLLCCLVCAGNAVLRYAFSIGSNAWLEAQWYMFAAIIMLGASYTLRANEHIRIDILYGRLSSRARAVVDLAGTIVFLLPLAILMAWLSWRFFADAWRSGEISNNAGGLIRWPVKLLLPVGFAMLGLQGLAEILKRIAVLRGLQDVDTDYRKPLQ